MPVFEIFLKDDDERSEYESLNKGFRNDVYIKVDNKYYNVSVYNIVRLQQDFEEESNSSGYYSMEANLILVNEVTKPEIVFTIQKLVDEKYFHKLKPIDSSNIIVLDLKKIF
ncbi:MAG: hypothetical protein HY064_14340 [Bacteroidetes bacterium]|nr:hypothetical protein [Bacteroidota bacterium]